MYAPSKRNIYPDQVFFVTKCGINEARVGLPFESLSYPLGDSGA